MNCVDGIDNTTVHVFCHFKFKTTSLFVQNMGNITRIHNDINYLINKFGNVLI